MLFGKGLKGGMKEDCYNAIIKRKWEGEFRKICQSHCYWNVIGYLWAQDLEITSRRSKLNLSPGNVYTTQRLQCISGMVVSAVCSSECECGWYPRYVACWGLAMADPPTENLIHLIHFTSSSGKYFARMYWWWTSTCWAQYLPLISSKHSSSSSLPTQHNTYSEQRKEIESKIK